MAAEIPLVESGTAGYLGQVQPLLKVRDLDLSTGIDIDLPNRTWLNASIAFQNLRQKRSLSAQFVPRQANLFIASSGVRAIFLGEYSTNVRVSSWEFMSHSQLFGEDEDAVGELDAAEQQGENGN